MITKQKMSIIINQTDLNITASKNAVHTFF